MSSAAEAEACLPTDVEPRLARLRDDTLLPLVRLTFEGDAGSIGAISRYASSARRMLDEAR